MFLFKRFLFSHIDHTWNDFSLSDFSVTPYRWVKLKVSDPSLVSFPFDCAGSQLVSKNIPRLHSVLEEITSPFQWCKASRANSILPEYNGSNPNEGHQSWESFASPSICSIGSLMPPDTSLIFHTLFLLLPQYTAYCRDSARSSKKLLISLQACTNVCSLWLGETAHAFTGKVLYDICIYL